MNTYKNEKQYTSLVEHDPIKLLDQFIGYWYRQVSVKNKNPKRGNSFEISHFNNTMDYFLQKAPSDYVEKLQKNNREKIKFLRHLNPSYCFLPNGYGLLPKNKLKTITYFDAKDLDSGIIGRKDKRRYCGIDPEEPMMKKQVLINVVSLDPRISQSSHFHQNDYEYIIAIDPTTLLVFPDQKKCRSYRLDPGELLMIGSNVFHTLINENTSNKSTHICIKFPTTTNDRKSSYPSTPTWDVKVIPKNRFDETIIEDENTKIKISYRLTNLQKSPEKFISLNKSILYICSGNVKYRFQGEINYVSSVKGSAILFNRKKFLEVKSANSQTALIFVLNQK